MIKSGVMGKLFGLLALLTLAGCGTLSSVSAEHVPSAALHQGADGDWRAEIDALAQPLVADQRATGLVVGVLFADRHKQVFGYGTTDQDGGHRPDGDTLFAIGSLSKSFLGAVTAMLVQEGRFHWDDTLETLLPGVELSADARKITLLQLVTHTSGLPRQPFTPAILLRFIRYLYTGDNFYQDYDTDYLLHYLADFTPTNKGVPQYSNTGYAILGHVIKLKMGVDADSLVNARLLQPLHLTATGYVPETLPGYERRAIGHAGDQPKFVRRGQRVPDWKFTDIMKGAAALYSNANDLLSYAEAYLHESGDAARDRALHEVLEVRVDRPIEAAATAWMVDTVGGQHITYQIGLVAGYTSYIGMDVESGTAVVVLQNSFSWSNEIGHQLLHSMWKSSRNRSMISAHNGASE